MCVRSVVRSIMSHIWRKYSVKRRFSINSNSSTSLSWYSVPCGTGLLNLSISLCMFSKSVFMLASCSLNNCLYVRKRKLFSFEEFGYSYSDPRLFKKPRSAVVVVSALILPTVSPSLGSCFSIGPVFVRFN